MALTHSCVWYEWEFAKKFYATYSPGVRWAALTDLDSVGRGRCLANVAVLYATKYRHTLAAADKTEANALIDDVNAQYALWCTQWASPLVAYPLILAAWLMDQVASDDKVGDIATNMTTELDYWEAYNGGDPETGYIDDSKAESNGWTACLLYLGGCVWSDAGWKAQGKNWGYFTLSYSDDSYGGTTGIQTIYENGAGDADFLDNACCHPNPAYAYNSIGFLARCQLAEWLVLNNTAILSEFSHRVDDVWRAHWDYVNSTTWKWHTNWTDTDCDTNDCRSEHGQDKWGNDMRCMNDAFVYKFIYSGQTSYDDVLEYEASFFDGNYTVYIEYNDGYDYNNDTKFLLDAVFMFRHLVAYWVGLQNAPRLYCREGSNMWYFKPDGIGLS